MDLDLDRLLLRPAGEAERLAGEIDFLPRGDIDFLPRGEIERRRGEGDLENFLRGGGERELKRRLYGAVLQSFVKCKVKKVEQTYDFDFSSYRILPLLWHRKRCLYL